MFVILATFTKPLEEIEPYVEARKEYLDRYYSKNIFLMSGRRIPPKGAVILANAESREVIEEILREDPYFVNDLADFEIIEFLPTKNHGAFDLL